MKLIIGLGNPGEKYIDTRHNIGFMVVDQLAREISDPSLGGDLWKKSTKANALYVKTKYRNQPVELLKPQTFMNRSGESVAYALTNHSQIGEIYIIYDDVDLEFGRIKIQPGGGGAGGHHGLESILQHTKNKLKPEQIIKFRIGIGRPQIGQHKFKSSQEMKLVAQETGQFCAFKGLKSWVLGKFTPEEKQQLSQVIDRATQALQITIAEDIQTAMNKYNGREAT